MDMSFYDALVKLVSDAAVGAEKTAQVRPWAPVVRVRHTGRPQRTPQRQAPRPTAPPVRQAARPAVAAPRLAAPAAGLPPTHYTVRSGDALSRIAARHNVSPRTLAQVNGIQNPNRIRPGQRLKLPPPPQAGTVSGRINDIAGYLHSKLNYPEAEAALLANINHETGGSFRYDQKQVGGSGWGLGQLTGPTRTTYDNWIAKSDRVDSERSQLDFLVDEYLPSRKGHSQYMSPGSGRTREEISDWMHRKGFTPAHSIPGNKAFSQAAIDARNNLQNNFMSNRIHQVNGVWRARP